MKTEKNKSVFLFSLAFVFIFLFFNLISADTIGTFKQAEDVRIIQTCNNCTYCNFTTYNPDSTELLSTRPAIVDEKLYYLDIASPNITQLGTYQYCYDCGNDVESVTGCNTFDITTSGEKDLLGLTIILIVGVYTIAFVGFFSKNEIIAIAGGMAMMILGVYTINYGIDIHRNLMTNVFSYFTLALGAIFSFWAGFALIQETYN